MSEEHKTPEEHSSLVGGSTAARRIGCPASYRLEQLNKTPDTGSVYAREGTTLHEMMAIILQDGVEPETLLPFTFKSESDGGWEFTVDEALWADKGQPALDAFDRFADALEQKYDAAFNFVVENRVAFPGIPNAFGTADIVGTCGPAAVVADWKFGRGIVPARENKQLMFYAAGALNSLPQIAESLPSNDAPLEIAIIQPARSGDIVDNWTTDLTRLSTYIRELRHAINLAKTDDAPCQTGSWCQFARCKVACPEHLGAAAKLSRRFKDLKDALEGKATPVNDLGSRYAELLELADLVEPLCKEIRDQAHEAAEGGLSIEGWQLSERRGRGRKWAAEEDVVTRYMRRNKIKIDEYAPRTMVTLPQAEKILKRHGIEMPEKFVEEPGVVGTKLTRAGHGEPVQNRHEKAATLAEKLAKL